MKTKSNEYDSLFGFLKHMGPSTKLLSRYVSKFVSKNVSNISEIARIWSVQQHQTSLFYI